MRMRAVFVGPLDSDRWVSTVFIGGIAVLFWFLVLPLAIVHGYLLRVMREGSGAPLNEDVMELVRDGIRVWIIAFVYLLVPLCIGVLTVGGAVLSFFIGTESGVLIGLTGLLLGGAITVTLGLLFGYAAIGGIVRYAHTGDLGAAFSIEIGRVLASETFLIAYGTSLVLIFLVGVIAAIPLVGWLIGPFAFFYVLVVSAELWSRGYQNAIERSG